VYSRAFGVHPVDLGLQEVTCLSLSALNSECWTKVDLVKGKDRIWIPGPKTLEDCQESCEQSSCGCVAIDWGTYESENYCMTMTSPYETVPFEGDETESIDHYKLDRSCLPR